jgi:putative phosphoesterase
MKKILLISDTHGHLDEKLIKYIQQSDEVWHAGDIGNLEVCRSIEKLKPLKAVWGNIDGAEARKNYQEDLVFNCENVKVYITHIGGYPNKYNSRALELIKKEKPDVFICGHSHILKVMHDKSLNLLHMNPGAAGLSGFHLVKTALLFDIENKDVKNLRIIELGPKTTSIKYGK